MSKKLNYYEKLNLRKKIVRYITYFMLGIWALVVLFPFYWMLLSSFKSFVDYNSETTPIRNGIQTYNPKVSSHMILT